MTERPAWHSLHWSGTVRDGGLILADWPAWLAGRDGEISVRSVDQICRLIDGGYLPSGPVSALALCYQVLAERFAQIGAANGEVAADALEADFDSLAGELATPVGHYAVQRIQGICDLHRYLLRGDELVARLFMEARRIDTELRRRLQRLWQSSVDQIAAPRVFAIDHPAAFGLGGGLLGWLNEREQPEACWSVSAELQPFLQRRMRRMVSNPNQRQVIIPVLALDADDRAWCTPAMAEACRQIPRERCWAMLPRVGWQRTTGRADMVSLPAEGFVGVVTETWTGAMPVIQDALGLGAETPPAF
jgi:hypothetical protein